MDLLWQLSDKHGQHSCWWTTNPSKMSISTRTAEKHPRLFAYTH